MVHAVKRNTAVWLSFSLLMGQNNAVTEKAAKAMSRALKDNDCVTILSFGSGKRGAKASMGALEASDDFCPQGFVDCLGSPVSPSLQRQINEMI